MVTTRRVMDYSTKNNMATLNSLPPPPQNQTGITLDQFKHLPPPPKGKVGVDPNQFAQSTQTPQPQSSPDFLQTAGDILNSFLPGKQIGNSLGTLGIAGAQAIGVVPGGLQGASDTIKTMPTVPQLIGDYTAAGLTVISPEVGGGTAPGLAGVATRVGSNALVGAGIGGANALSQGESNGDIATSAETGGLLAGGLSAAGEGVSAFAKNLPNWLTKAALPKLDSKDTSYALENAKIGSLNSMAQKSSQSMDNYESQIQAILSHPEHATTPEYTPASLFGDALKQFPNSDYTPDDLIQNAKSIAPKVSKLIGKVEDGIANLQEINSVRKELDQATKSVYTNINRPPESKMLGAALSNSLRKLVQTNAPETEPIFANYSKEIGLNKAIQSAVKKGQTKVSFKDIVAAGGGFAHGGLPGALEAIIAERALTSPTLQIAAAKGLSGAAKAVIPAAETAFQGLKAPIVKKTTNSP